MELNRIIHGDCLSVLPKLHEEAGEFADLIVTSPPFAEQRKKSYGGITVSYQFKAHTQLSYETAKRIAPIVIGLIGCPRSVVDLGSARRLQSRCFQPAAVY